MAQQVFSPQVLGALPRMNTLGRREVLGVLPRENPWLFPNGRLPLTCACRAAGETTGTFFEELDFMNDDVARDVAAISSSYTARKPDVTAKALRNYWLRFAPNKGIQLIKAAQREQLEMAGTPVPILKAIGKEISKTARKSVPDYIPLAQLLWDEYGREGRLVALIVFGAMELIEPKRIVPLLRVLCRQSVSWEDADRLAMDAVEPIVRKHPEQWLTEMRAWLDDENRWVRRAAITIIGRLPMKHPAYVSQCLELAEQLLPDTDTDVRRATSFAIRTCARVDPKRACAFLKGQVPPDDPAAVWVLCDSIKSMDHRIIAHFTALLPRYKKWGAAPDTSSKDRRSIESAIKALRAT